MQESMQEGASETRFGSLSATHFGKAQCTAYTPAREMLEHQLNTNADAGGG